MNTKWPTERRPRANENQVVGRMLMTSLESAHMLTVDRFVKHARCYVSHIATKRCLTSEFGERTNRAAMITSIRKQLNTCAATGSYSPSWLHCALGEFSPRVRTVEF